MTMTLKEFRHAMAFGYSKDDGELERTLRAFNQEALRITAELNGTYHSPEEVRALMERLTGESFDDSLDLRPPFYTDCGKNLRMGKRVFINSGCHFQDQGGIDIGDDVFIGPQTIIATLNHDPAPDRRAHLFPKPVRIGNNVWLGARVTLCPGVTIGDGAIIAAGAVVTRNISSFALAAGIPARIIRRLDGRETRDNGRKPS